VVPGVVNTRRFAREKGCMSSGEDAELSVWAGSVSTILPSIDCHAASRG
jgi:hypothetical protein